MKLEVFVYIVQKNRLKIIRVVRESGASGTRYQEDQNELIVVCACYI